MKIKFSLKPDMLTILFAILALVAGVFLAGDFGESWDEYGISLFGDAIQDAYHPPFSYSQVEYSFEPAIHFYGPAFSLIVSVLRNLILETSDHAQIMAQFHFFEFATFVLGSVSLYVIAKRFMTDLTALAVTGLFFSQPLLFGHAFINPKDIPFMGFFTATIACGLVMTDRISSLETAAGDGFSWKDINSKRKPLSAKDSKRLALAAALLIILTLAISLNWNTLTAVVSEFIANLFTAPEDSFGAKLIKLFVPNRQNILITSYQNKAIHQLRKWLIFAGVGSALLLTGTAAWISFSEMIKALYHEFFGPTLKSPKTAVIHITQNRRWVWVLLTGILLGITTAIRVVGPAALFFILFYAISKDHRNWLAAGSAVLVFASLVTYISWPYLWGAPLTKLVLSYKKMANFNWHGPVLFNGQLFTSTSLPPSFLPKLIAIQFTEPAVLLILIGFVVMAVQLYKRSTSFIPALLILGWAFLPILYVIFSQPTIYDNGRQFLFIFPPLFIVAGFGLEWLFSLINRKIWRIALTILVLLPGLVGIIQLHPYEYIYYNQFTGGVSGAYRNYELDYWGTSIREAAEYLNEHAEPNSNVAVITASHLLSAYTREDIIITSMEDLGDAEWPGEFNYLVLFTRANGEIYNTLNREVVFKVSRDGINLLTIEAID